MNTGDTVYLKSGGPMMTVNNRSPKTGGLLCVWFTGDEHHEAWFNKDAVVGTEPTARKNRSNNSRKKK